MADCRRNDSSQAEAEHSPDVATAAPLLHRALPLIGHFQIRNRGTVGGSTAHADPASELPAVTVALDAELVVQGPAGVRAIPARDFFISTWTTAARARRAPDRDPLPHLAGVGAGSRWRSSLDAAATSPSPGWRAVSRLAATDT